MSKPACLQPGLQQSVGPGVAAVLCLGRHAAFIQCVFPVAGPPEPPCSAQHSTVAVCITARSVAVACGSFFLQHGCSEHFVHMVSVPLGLQSVLRSETVAQQCSGKLCCQACPRAGTCVWWHRGLPWKGKAPGLFKTVPK